MQRKGNIHTRHRLSGSGRTASGGMKKNFSCRSMGSTGCKAVRYPLTSSSASNAAIASADGVPQMAKITFSWSVTSLKHVRCVGLKGKHERPVNQDMHACMRERPTCVSALLFFVQMSHCAHAHTQHTHTHTHTHTPWAPTDGEASGTKFQSRWEDSSSVPVSTVQRSPQAPRLEEDQDTDQLPPRCRHRSLRPPARSHRCPRRSQHCPRRFHSTPSLPPRRRTEERPEICVSHTRIHAYRRARAHTQDIHTHTPLFLQPPPMTHLENRRKSAEDPLALKSAESKDVKRRHDTACGVFARFPCRYPQGAVAHHPQPPKEPPPHAPHALCVCRFRRARPRIARGGGGLRHAWRRRA